MVGALAATSAAAQLEPDEGWQAYPPVAPPPLVPAPPPAPAPVRTPLPAAVAALEAEVQRPAPPAELRPPNDVSMLGAPALGLWRRAVSATLGYPLVSLRGGVGVAPGLDVGIDFDSYYGAMNELRGYGRYQFLVGPRWTASAALEGGAALFSQRAAVEDHGARWVTGHRNYNLMPGLVLSYRGQSPRAARLFLDLRWHFAFDTEPHHRQPLGGVPPPFELGQNLVVRAGAELPLTARVSLAFLTGFDLHGSPDDAPFMPVCSVGLVSGI